MERKKRTPAHDQLGRMKEILGVRADIALAPYLGVNQNTLAEWKNKSYKWVPPHILIKFALRYGISLDWLLFGTGEKKADHSAFKYINEPGFVFNDKAKIAKTGENNETK